MQQQRLIRSLKSLNPLVVAAATSAGFEQLTVQQHRILELLNANVPDVIAETMPKCGHVVIAVLWAAHCVLSATDGTDKLAFVIAKSEAAVHVLADVAKRLSIHGCRYSALGPHDDGRGMHKDTKMVFLSAIAYRRLAQPVAQRSATVVFEDVSEFSVSAATDLVEMAVTANPAASLCLLTSAPPSSVDVSMRYLLRRSNRRYVYADRCPSASFTTLLCHDNNERNDLSTRIAQLRDFRRVLILTHNKEVRSLRQDIQDKAKLNCFAVHRATPNGERQRVLADFIQSRFAVLVAMDAFTGIDLMDVDAVINYYPPQKSMPDDEWDTYVACIQSTGDPAKPCLVATIAAPDDITMVAFFFQKLGISAPIINVSPTHPDFEDLVRFPEAVLMLTENSPAGAAALEAAAAAAAGPSTPTAETPAATPTHTGKHQNHAPGSGGPPSAHHQQGAAAVPHQHAQQHPKGNKGVPAGKAAHMDPQALQQHSQGNTSNSNNEAPAPSLGKSGKAASSPAGGHKSAAKSAAPPAPAGKQPHNANGQWKQNHNKEGKDNAGAAVSGAAASAPSSDAPPRSPAIPAPKSSKAVPPPATSGAAGGSSAAPAHQHHQAGTVPAPKSKAVAAATAAGGSKAAVSEGNSKALPKPKTQAAAAAAAAAPTPTGPHKGGKKPHGAHK